MGQVAWVTGGGTGIGRALAEALYQQGYTVAISGRREDILQEAARQISTGTGPGQILCLPGDISARGYVDTAMATLSKTCGKVDLLINNAGVNPHHHVPETTLEEFQKTFEINCLASIACAMAVLPGMRSAKQGAIVNISSILGKWASGGSTAYSVSKYALAGSTDALRQDLIGSGIHVMGVYPGYIQTAMTAPFVEPGSFKARFAATPQRMAAVILKGLRRRKAEIFYPWYVPWALRFHRWCPGISDRIASRIRT